jgi:phage terminase large subunit-like protein
VLERKREAYYNYEPYCNRRAGEPGWQWKFLAAAGGYKGRLALGGNRIGKSDQGAYESVLAITGRHPFREFPKRGKIWIVGLDYNMVRDVNLPKFDKFLPRHYRVNSKFSKADSIWHIEGEDREWVAQFKSSDAGRAKFQGEAVDAIWFDEEPLKIDIWSECMRALIDRAGIWWMTATPVLGTAWLKELSEKDTVFTTTGAMWDNPYIPLEEVEAQAEELDEDEKLVRIEGQYVVFGGSPVFNIRVLNEVIEGLRDDIPVSDLILYEAA